MTKYSFLFPGQGSQIIGMGQSFYSSSLQVRTLFEHASDITGLNLENLCFEGPMETLTETANLQPAIITAELAGLILLEEAGMKPEYVAGHSLGEYAALIAAKVISLSDGLKLVAARGRLMQREADKVPGAMTAVMRMDPEALEQEIDTIAAEETLCLANYNTPQQLVASGTLTGISRLETRLKEQGKRFKRLQVAAGLHSKLMEGAEAEFAQVLDEVEFGDAQVPVILNVTGCPSINGPFIKKQMRRQICSGVRWYQGMRTAWQAGARTFLEIGPKSILMPMLKRIVPEPGEIKGHHVHDIDSFKLLVG